MLLVEDVMLALDIDNEWVARCTLSHMKIDFMNCTPDEFMTECQRAFDEFVDECANAVQGS